MDSRPREPEGTFLCAVDEIEDGGAKNFIGTVDGKQRNIFAVRRGGNVFLYLNSCPHNRVPLDFTPGKFFSLDKRFLQCSTHGALFEIKSGECVSGPCTGDFLKALKAEIRDGALYHLA